MRLQIERSSLAVFSDKPFPPIRKSGQDSTLASRPRPLLSANGDADRSTAGACRVFLIQIQATHKRRSADLSL